MRHSRKAEMRYSGIYFLELDLIISKQWGWSFRIAAWFLINGAYYATNGGHGQNVNFLIQNIWNLYFKVKLNKIWTICYSYFVHFFIKRNILLVLPVCKVYAYIFSYLTKIITGSPPACYTLHIHRNMHMYQLQ